MLAFVHLIPISILNHVCIQAAPPPTQTNIFPRRLRLRKQLHEADAELKAVKEEGEIAVRLNEELRQKDKELKDEIKEL